MKALDKVFDTQVIIKVLLVINFHFIEAKKKISYMKKEKENRQERRYRYNRYRRKSNNRIYRKSK